MGQAGFGLSMQRAAGCVLNRFSANPSRTWFKLMKLIRIRVRAYAGAKGDESPRSFDSAGRTYRISKITRTWIEEDADTKQRAVHFLVLADDQERHLMYKPKLDAWFLQGAL